MFPIELSAVEVAFADEKSNMYLNDSPQLNEDDPYSKFAEGVLQADGVTKRFEARGWTTPVRPLEVYSHKAEADEGRLLNQWHQVIRKFPDVSTSCLFKTAEVRKAELEAILERSMR